MVGKGGNLLIIDDPYKNLEEANSPKHRLRIEQWVDAVARTRLEPGGSMILNMTRWHDKDLAAYLKSKGNFQEIVFPAIAEGQDVLGRVKGDPLCADRFNLEALESIKHDIGSYNWNSLYQQNPIPIEGGLFKRHWWKFYDTAPTDGRIVQFWDCAQKVGITNDYSVCTTWMEKNGNFFALDRWKNKVEAPDLQRAVVSNFYAHNADLVVVEDKSSGSSLIQYLKRETMLPLLPYDPGQKDKQVRASSATGLVESGRCFLPSSSNWTEDFILEHERFPNAEHDDQVDTTSMMADYFRKPRPEPRIRIL
jgi:predicted phage terminase large subunit-like protein